MVSGQLRARGIKDERVLNAMAEIPRDAFVPAESRHAAYEDRALSIACNQTVSQPYMVAVMMQALAVQPHHTVLEVGTGSGYQTMLLARLAAHVITVERIPKLARDAKNRLAAFGVSNVSFVVADGSAGFPGTCPRTGTMPLPFERILVSAGAPHVPRPLLNQLTEGGRLVIPVGGEQQQNLLAIDRFPGRTVETCVLPCRFVKLIGQRAW